MTDDKKKSQMLPRKEVQFRRKSNTTDTIYFNPLPPMGQKVEAQRNASSLANRNGQEETKNQPNERNSVDVSAYRTEKNSENQQSYIQQAASSTVSDKSQKDNSSKDDENNLNQMSLYQIKQMNKDLAAKANLITNRINKLVTEEKMLKKKAADTQERANEIYENKLLIKIKKEEKNKFRSEVEDVPFTHPKGQLEMEKCKISRKLIESKNQEESLAFKIEMAHIFSERNRQEEIHNLYLKQRAEKIRISKEASRTSKQEFINNKITEIHREQKQVLKHETNQIKQKKKLLNQLEKIEMEHMKRLNNTKQQSRNAFNQLEYIKNRHPDDYQNQFTRQPFKRKNNNNLINGHPASNIPSEKTIYVLTQDNKGKAIIQINK